MTFKDFCLFNAREFFEARPELLNIAGRLEDFYFNKNKKIINVCLPPRFGKSRLATLMAVWLLITDPKRRVLRVAYSAELAEIFSQQTKTIYIDFFEKLKKGGADITVPEVSGTRARWKLPGFTEPAHIGTGVEGTITGFGCDVAIVDDTVKGMMEATSAAVSNQLKLFKESVLLSRLENEKKIINVGTRWTLSDWFAMFAADEVVTVRALTEEGESVCPAWQTTEQLTYTRSQLSPAVWAAQYMQAPVVTGQVRLFEGLKFPAAEPPLDAPRYVVIDPATDFGKDFFTVIYFAIWRGQVYVLDIFAKAAATVVEVAAWIRGKTYNGGACEANGIGRYILSDLRKQGVGGLRAFTTRENKYSRAARLMDKVKNYVNVSQNCTNRDLLLQQTDGFPVADHDDLLDALLMIFEHFRV